MEAAAALLDVDGTLVDSNYHHALCWYRALRAHGITRPVWQLHSWLGAPAAKPPAPGRKTAACGGMARRHGRRHGRSRSPIW